MRSFTVKRYFVMVLIVFLLLTAASCGMFSKQKYVGSWKAGDVRFVDNSGFSNGGYLRCIDGFVLYEDGTCWVDKYWVYSEEWAGLLGADEYVHHGPEEGTWEIEDGELVIRPNHADTERECYRMTYVDGKLEGRTPDSKDYFDFVKVE